jgi:protein O-GlcNAc transferase
MGADFIDYFISDAVATPAGYEREFTERVVRLPGTYQVNDSRQPMANLARTRADEGLPAKAFVYCSFNRVSKIDRTVFFAWMDILRAVPDSVLWLLHGDPEAERNLRRAAAGAGVAGERLVFAGNVPKPEHLARHRLADLFLDTTVYNAHTGTSDALWAGLPVLTTPGRTFAARVAASLLHACGMPELAVHDLHAYREAAIRYGTDRSALAAVTAKLRAIGPASALFDTRRFVGNLEAAYARMHALSLAGRAPESFSIEDAQSRA